MAMRNVYRRHKRKLKSEINVVPYIDVMLVLLIIFMVTTPMMNLGVDIQLPQTNAKSLQDKKDPIVVSVDEAGQIYLTANGAKREPVSADEFRTKITAFHNANPNSRSWSRATSAWAMARSIRSSRSFRRPASPRSA